MMKPTKTIPLALLCAAVLSAPQAGAQTDPATAQTACDAADRACLTDALERTAAQIENKAWRDQTYRELAKTLAEGKKIDEALSLIPRIESSDTQAMTIRGIGMEAADLPLSQDEYDTIFSKLRTAAEKIEHPPSYAIALTYIAMAQAFAGDNDGAWKTASDMDNEALRHKAYQETAEIQAEQGQYDAAMKSIGFIGSVAFRNKAYGNISKILAERGQFQDAYGAAQEITNAYKKAVAIQYILDMQTALKRAQEKAAEQGNNLVE